MWVQLLANQIGGVSYLANVLSQLRHCCDLLALFLLPTLIYKGNFK